MVLNAMGMIVAPLNTVTLIHLAGDINVFVSTQDISHLVVNVEIQMKCFAFVICDN